MRRSTFVLGVGSVLGVAPLVARAQADPLDRYMAPHVQMAEFAGVVVIAPGGRPRRVRAFGGTFSDLTRFRVASMAKTFAAATMGALIAAGKAALDDRLGRYLPAFARSRITLRQLLDHSAGVRDIYVLPAFMRGHGAPISRSDYIDLLANTEPDFAPGAKSSYSNSGYALLAFAVEAIANESFGGAQRRLILGPLGLDDTGTLPGRDVLAGADPGAPNATRPAEFIDPSWLIGNGSLYSSARDMTAWLAAIRAGTIVKTRSWPYPWGWGQKAKGRVLDGDGRYAGFACDTLLDLESGDAVVVLSAIQSAVVDPIARDLFGSIHGTVPAPIPTRTCVPLAPGTPATYVGTYRLSPDFAVSVAAFGDEIQIAGPDGVFESLDPLGDDRFHMRVLDAGMVFVRDARGAVAGIDWGPGSFRLAREARSTP